MQEIRYYPLVDATTDGKIKSPMFHTTSKDTVEEKHKFYLEEMIPHYYRLYVSKPKMGISAKGFDIQCPICGSTMKAISKPLNSKKKSLYTCEKCNH